MRRSYIDGRLSQKHIQELNELGMSWNAFDAKWEQGYGLAVEYAAENGNLNVPVSYVTLEGQKLGLWLCNQRAAYLNGNSPPTKSADWKQSGCTGATGTTGNGTKFIRPQSDTLRRTETLMCLLAMFRRRAMPLENGCGGSSMHIGIRRRAMRFYHKSALSCWMPSECSGRNRTRGSTGTSWRRSIKDAMEIWRFR